MQLLQDFGMFSWHLPPRWQIVATANPDGAEYSVTPMDDAMLTRTLHLTLVFDPFSWALWAVAARVDGRGIDFVLHYPESVAGRRTTPRTLTYSFEQITRSLICNPTRNPSRSWRPAALMTRPWRRFPPR